MKKLIYILLFLSFSCQKQETKKAIPEKNLVINWIKRPTESIAGTPLSFKLKNTFKKSHIDHISLLISNSWTQTIITPLIKNGDLIFNVPEHIYNKFGATYTELLYFNNSIDQYSFSILPQSETVILENYFGPQYLVAGDRDYAGLVTIPTDRHDNPNFDNFVINELYYNSLKTYDIIPTEIIHWKNIYSRKKVGKIFISVIADPIKSKELIAPIAPANSSDFQISYTRNHTYADGKELTTLMTSKILDIYGNTIADGTLVTFIIKTEHSTLKAYGTTINGVATTLISNPKKAINYNVTGYIMGFSKSNTVMISYNDVIEAYKNLKK